MKRTFSILCSVLLTAGFAVSSQAQTPTPSARITVDASKKIGKVNPLVFGHNIEAADPKGIFGPNSSPEVTRTGTGIWNPETQSPVTTVINESKTLNIKMLRYPGGCLVHGFDWKKAAGPLELRPEFAFGIDEYLKVCRAIGAEPLMNVSDYFATPQDAADLVEYLNAPADNKHPWAKKRAQWGHPQPYGVKYFEMGNETDHGNHELQPPKKWTASEYSQWFNECSKKMRAVDPSIKMGALMGTGTGPDDSWNETVLRTTKGNADFIIIHTYAVGLWAPETSVGGFAGGSPVAESGDLLTRAAMASVEQFEVMLSKYRTHIREYSGRALPLAITEYNASYVQEKPLPYRFSFAAALFSADYLRILMQPQSNVLMANYWQYLNGYWGFLQGPRLPDEPQTWKKLPAYYLFRLWSQHFGTELISTQVNSPSVEFEGFRGNVLPARGKTYQAATVEKENLLDKLRVRLLKSEGENITTQVREDGTQRAEFKNLTGEQYPLIAQLPGHQDAYAISFEARVTGDVSGAHLGLGLADSRGWDTTKSAIGVEGAQTATNWKTFKGRFITLPDSQGIDLVWRLRAGDKPINGSLEIRNLRVSVFHPESFPAYAAITSTSSLSSDGKKLYVMIFNKHHAQNVKTQLSIRSFNSKTARHWTVTGSSLEATNLNSTEVKETVTNAPVAVKNNTLQIQIPARSMTAIELTKS